MGYVCKKVRTKEDGSIYWQVVYEDRRKDRPKNQPRETPIHRSQLRTLGIDEQDTFDRAKEIVSELNSKSRLEKAGERIKVRALRRQTRDQLVKSSFLPESDVKAFEDKVLFQRLAGDEESLKFRRLLSHWAYTQKLIAKLEIEPKDYADEAFIIYRYIRDQKTSPAYASKILRILNAWGHFYTKRHGGTGIMEVKMPRGKYRQDIARANQQKDDYRGEASALLHQELIKAESHLIDYNYNWLYLSLWLGLRPEEVEGLKNRKTWRTEKQDEVTVLWVFQSKLVGVSEEQAWKPIPIIYPQQVACMEIIAIGNFKKPLNKTLRKIFGTKRITTYSGRKGFTDLMLSLGQPLEEISIWMGHKSIETTWRHYKQKHVVRFNKIAS